MNKDIMYIIKRVIIGVLIGLILFSFKSCTVKALSNENLGTYISETGMFLSLNSVNQTSQSGYSLIKGSDFYYALPSGQPFTYGTYGGSITQCDIPVVANNYYALTYYFISNDTYSFHPDYSAFGYKVGVNSTWLNTVPTFNLTSKSGANQFVCISGFNSPFGDCISSFTGIFKAPSNNTCVTMAFSSASHDVTTSEVAFVGYTYESLGNEPLSESQITTIINNSNQQVLNNIQSSTTSIINNQNSNTQSIITNQNQNTQQQIESEQVCFDYTIQIDNSNRDSFTPGFLVNNGNISSNSIDVVSNYIAINKNTLYTLNYNYNGNLYRYCTYDNNKVLQNCFEYSSVQNYTTFFTTFDGYVRFTSRTNSSYYTRFTGKYCGNGNQQISGQITDVQDKQDITNDKLNDINNTMNDSSTDSPNSGINAVKNGLASNGVITQLITLPVTLFQQILTSINGTCQTFNLGSLLGTDLILPCINVSNYLGTTLWGIIDVIISGYFVWVIARKMISAFEMFSAMKDGDVLDD